MGCADGRDAIAELAAYDTGDHLHLNAAGYQQVADVISLALFVR